MNLEVNDLKWCTNSNGFEQCEKVMKGNRERMLPIATLHPEHDYEFVLEKTGLTTPSQLCEPKLFNCYVKDVLPWTVHRGGQPCRPPPPHRLQRPDGHLVAEAALGSQQ